MTLKAYLNLSISVVHLTHARQAEEISAPVIDYTLQFKKIEEYIYSTLCTLSQILNTQQSGITDIEAEVHAVKLHFIDDTAHRYITDYLIFREVHNIVNMVQELFAVLKDE